MKSLISILVVVGFVAALRAVDLPPVPKVELQPLAAQVARLQDALDFLGSPWCESRRTERRAQRSGPTLKSAIRNQTTPTA